METDSSDEPEVYVNTFSSSSSSDDQDNATYQPIPQALCTTRAPAGSSCRLFERDLMPFHDVSTTNLVSECAGVDQSSHDDIIDGVQNMFEELNTNSVHLLTDSSTNDKGKTLCVFDDDDDDDDDEDDDDSYNSNDEDDNDLSFDLFGECERTSSTNQKLRREARDNDMIKYKNSYSAKTKVDQDIVTKEVERNSILDDILKLTDTTTDMGDSGTKLKVKEVVLQEEDFCCICRDVHSNPVVLPKCSHKYCRECIDEYFKIKPVCPECFMPYGIITGNQPEGHMDHSVNKKLILGGSSTPGAIVIYYYFNSGTQTAEHPKPGVQYHGTNRTAYLPDTPEGNKVLRLLQEAFKRRLVFTVGRSRTTGADNQVTWNDIHHKTCPCGGQENFGYPDPTYLKRVQEELAAVGVTEESLAAGSAKP